MFAQAQNCECELSLAAEVGIVQAVLVSVIRTGFLDILLGFIAVLGLVLVIHRDHAPTHGDRCLAEKCETHGTIERIVTIHMGGTVMPHQVFGFCVTRQKPKCGLLCKGEVVKRLVVLEIIARASWEHLFPAVFW